MKPLLFILLFCINSSFATKVSIIPEPVKTEIYKGKFTINANSRIYFDDKNPQLARHANYFTTVVAAVSGLELETSKNKAQSQVRLLIGADPTIGQEGYYLTINNKGVTITANSCKGIFYGLQSLLQFAG